MNQFNQPYPSSINYRADIDGLRAVAVLLVLIFHFNLLMAGEAGFIGVDVFFVISGYLITSIIVKQCDRHEFDLRKFYLNRIRRLAPALFVVLSLVVVVGAFWLFPADFVELAKQVLVSQFYVANIYYWRSINYFGLHTEDVYLLHTWSLAVEEQFYLLYPLFILICRRYLKPHFQAVIACAAVLSFCLNIFFVQSRPEATFYLLPTRAWELLLGGFLSTIAGNGLQSRLARNMLGATGFGLLLVAVITFSREVQFPGFFALLPAFGAVCLILSGAGAGSGASKLLGVGPVTYVGKISYPLYLIHWPVNVFAAQMLDENYSTAWRWGMFGLSLLLASAIYHVVETPLRVRKILSKDGGLGWAYVGGLSATMLFFLAVQLTEGLPGRFPDQAMEIARYADDKTAPLSDCEYSGNGRLNSSRTCQIGDPGAPATWLVYGDSHAWAGHEVFDKWLKGRREAGVFQFRNSCPPLAGVHIFNDKGICHAFNDAVLAHLEGDTGIQRVLLVSTWRQAREGRLSVSPDVALSEHESIQLFRRQFSATVGRLRGMGKVIYVWEPVPGARSNVPVSMARALISGGRVDVGVSQGEFESNLDYFFESLEESRGQIFMSFSPASAICRERQCAVDIDGKPAYFDTDHIARSSSEFWVRMMQRTEIERADGAKLLYSR